MFEIPITIFIKVVLFIFVPFEEIIQRVKQSSGREPFRPVLPSNHERITPALLHLIRDCWAEDSSKRPDFPTILKQLVAKGGKKYKKFSIITIFVDL